MKITFLGTSHGYAEKGRFTSSTLVEADGCSYIIDAGAPVEALLINHDKDLADIRGVFITHMHADHISNLSSLTEPFTRFRYNDKSTCFLPEKEGLDAFLAWMKALHCDTEKMQQVVKFAVTQEGLIYNENNMKVTAIPTLHMQNGKYPAFSYMLEHGGKRVLFTGDMASNFPEYESIVGDREYDLVICEMAHSRLCNVWEKLAATKTKKMIINHYWAPTTENYEEIFQKFPFDVQLAQDGACLIV